MPKRFLAGVVAIVILAIAGLYVLAYQPSIAPVTAGQRFAADHVANGAILAAAGNCAECHTVKGGRPYAGGYPMTTTFGTIYSTNITPDVETGIGAWSEAAFRRAMHQGVARDGSQLFPAFPYDHFTKLSDADVGALYAYLMTQTPVQAPPKQGTIPFPLNLRPLQAGWKLLFFKPGRFAPDAAHDAAWNRGAYLAEALGHCGACHTPRNRFGAEQADHAYAGAPIDGWIAPALTAANPSPVAWSTPELAQYLTTGISQYHGTAVGPMSAVVHNGVARLPPTDQAALAVYVASLGGGAGRLARNAAAIAGADAADAAGWHPHDDYARLFTAACASCHYRAGSPNPLRPDIGLNSAANLDEPTNLVRVILYGIGAEQGAPGIVMPGFIGYSNADVARLAAHIRKTRTTKPAWTDLERKVAAIRAAGGKES
ncbi:MAG: cytochrome c [Sandarakinorhabdus sp.]|nr:cytochrome c [Sandarakinorhabdus sp.]